MDSCRRIIAGLIACLYLAGIPAAMAADIHHLVHPGIFCLLCQ
jgi:hypothetical protein